MNAGDMPPRLYGIAPPAFTLPEETHIGMVRLQVSDLQRSATYYQHVLGFRIQTPTADAATAGPHADEHPLLQLRTARGVRPARRGAFGLYHIAILLPDRASLGRFAAHVSSLGVRIGMADHLVSEALYLWDPDDLGIEVYADRPRATWHHRNRELVMTTDPLDVASVIAAGGDEPWNGMPPGTRIGHVHLHVGSLGEAEAFYHTALGLEKMGWSYPGALFFAAGGYHHHLGTNVWSSGPSATEDEARLIDWELVVPHNEDVLASMRNLQTAGQVADASADGYTATDPWGTQLRVVSPVNPPGAPR